MKTRDLWIAVGAATFSAIILLAIFLSIFRRKPVAIVVRQDMPAKVEFHDSTCLNDSDGCEEYSNIHLDNVTVVLAARSGIILSKDPTSIRLDNLSCDGHPCSQEDFDRLEALGVLQRVPSSPLPK